MAVAAGLALTGCANAYEQYARHEGVAVSCGAGAPCHPCNCDAPAAAPCAERPPEAKCGEAWCKVWIPPVYETRWETVQVQCASSRCEWVPPVYETRMHEVCVRPPCAKEIRTPAVSRTIEECVEVCPSRCELQRVCCPADPCPNPCAPQQKDCYAMVEVPAQTAKVCREVCVSPASSHMAYEPALYETVVQNCEVKPGFWRNVPVPPVFDRVCHQVCVQPGRWEWRRNDACVVPAPCAPSPCAPPAPVVTAPR